MGCARGKLPLICHNVACLGLKTYTPYKQGSLNLAFSDYLDTQFKVRHTLPTSKLSISHQRFLFRYSIQVRFAVLRQSYTALLSTGHLGGVLDFSCNAFLAALPPRRSEDSLHASPSPPLRSSEETCGVGWAEREDWFEVTWNVSPGLLGLQ